MNNEGHNPLELTSVRLRLRDDLRFALQEHGTQACYVVEDPLNGKFYRIGIPEYALLSCLDGKTSLAEALQRTTQQLGDEAFGELDAAAIASWLVDNALATTSASTSTDRLVERFAERTRRRRWQRLNPLVIKIPLANPQRLVDWCVAKVGWVFHRNALCVWMAVVVFALIRLTDRWADLSPSANLLLAGNTWLWLALSWVCLKLLHELGHAVLCRRLGGSVREVGVVLILFAPIPYVDVTSTWRFASKWQRIAVSAAGMYVELFIAAVAALIWTSTDSPPAQFVCYNVMLLAGLTTLLFNANFLMRFDGYYMWADWLEIPNLYGLGQQYLKYLGRRYVAGIPLSAPRWPAHKSIVVPVYGVTSFCWRLLVCVALIVGASTLFYGLGVLLAVVAIVCWFALPLVHLANYVAHGNRGEQPDRRRLALVSAAICGLLAIAGLLPMPGSSTLPAVVRFTAPEVVRPESPGFVRELQVEDGQFVRTGQVLCVLENRELAAEVADLRLSVRESRLRSRVLHRDQKVAELQAENETRLALTERLEQRQQDLENLTIQANSSGRVIASDLGGLAGQWVVQGQPLMTIADPSRVELVAAVSQRDCDQLRQRTGAAFEVHLESCSQPPPFTLAAITPQAVLTSPHAALSAANGGPLPVVPTGGDPTTTAPQYELLTPHFVATFQTDVWGDVGPPAGLVATISTGLPGKSLLGYCWERLSTWMSNKAA